MLLWVCRLNNAGLSYAEKISSYSNQTRSISFYFANSIPTGNPFYGGNFMIAYIYYCHKMTRSPLKNKKNKCTRSVVVLQILSPLAILSWRKLNDTSIRMVELTVCGRKVRECWRVRALARAHSHRLQRQWLELSSRVCKTRDPRDAVGSVQQSFHKRGHAMNCKKGVFKHIFLDYDGSINKFNGFPVTVDVIR